MLRKDAIGVMAAVLLLLPTACTGSAADTDDSDLLVAASLELTGSAADVGVAHERALRLRVEQINASGVLRGRTLRLVVNDNRSDSTVAVGQVTRFADDAAVTAIVIGACGECAVAAANVVNDKGVPMISLSAATQVSSPVESRRFVFRLGPNVADDSRALVTELTRAGIKTVALVTPDDAYGGDARETMARDAAKAGMTVTATARFAPGESDLTGAARVAVDGRPDAVVVWASPTQAGLAASALREAGHRGRLYFDAAAAGNLFLSGSAAAAEGASMVFTQTLAMDDVIATTPAKAAQKQWFEDYTSRHGSYHGQASFGADAVQLIVDAAQRVSSRDRAAMRGELETIQADGLSGPLRMTPANHSGLMPQALTVLVARSGRWRLLG